MSPFFVGALSGAAIVALSVIASVVAVDLWQNETRDAVVCEQAMRYLFDELAEQYDYNFRGERLEDPLSGSRVSDAIESQQQLYC
jgi:hypothetical protein